MIGHLVGMVAATLTFSMCEGGDVPPACCNTGDRLNVTMLGGSVNQRVARCEDMGGAPVYYPAAPLATDGLVICNEVSF